MGILDQIANPQVPSYLEGLQVIDALKTRKEQRNILRLQGDEMLRKQQREKEIEESRAKGRALIEGYLEPVEKTIPESDFSPKEPTPLMMKEAMTPVVNVMNKFSVKDIDEDKDLGKLGKRLMAIEGMENTAKLLIDIDMKMDKAELAKSAAQRKEDQEIFEAAFNPIREVALLEEAGDKEQAERKFDQLRSMIMNDPRFNQNENAMKFLNAFKEYQPGIGKYMYLSAMTREQALREGGKGTDWVKFTDDQGEEWLVNRVTDEKKPLGKGFKGAKEEAIQKRAEEAGKRSEERLGLQKQAAERSKERIKLQEEKQELTQKKFEIGSTDKILTHKRQEEKDLKEIKRNLSRALILVREGKNFTLADKLLHQSMSKWENTSVRAYAELEKFKNLGDIEQRIAGTISQFFAGEMTDEQRKIATDTAKTLLDEYIEPILDESDDYWRRIASERNLDPDQVSPFGSKEEVGEAYRDGIISREQAEKILKKPRFK